MKNLITIMTLGVALASTAALADESTVSHTLQQDQGFYVGLLVSPIAETASLQTDDDGRHFDGGFVSGGEVNFGYQFNRYVAVEANVAAIDLPYETAAGVALKGILPVGNRVDFYGKAGLSALNFSFLGFSETIFTPVATAGMGVYATKNVEFNVQQSAYFPVSSDEDDPTVIGLTSVGLTVHF